MRVTNNVVQNMAKISNNKVSKLTGVNVGEVLSAKIIEVSGDKVIAEIKGKLVLLNDLLNIDLFEGQELELKVADVVEGRVYTKPNTPEFKEEYNVKLAVNELKHLGIETNDKNVKILKFLKENNISYNKAEVEKLIDNVKLVSKLADDIKGEKVDFSKMDIKNDLKSEIIKIITNNTTTNKAEVSVKEVVSEKVPETLIKNEPLNMKKAEVTPVKELATEVVKTNVVIESELKETKVIEDIKSLFKDNTIETGKDNNLKFTESFSKELGNVKIEELLFLIKEKMDINVMNLLLTKNLFSSEKSIGNSLNQINEIFKGIPPEKVAGFEKILLEVFKSEEVDEKKIENLFKELFSDEEESGKVLEAKEKVKSELNFIKMANDFNVELEERLNYYQFAKFDNDYFQNTEILAKKNSNSGVKIYLSLDTNNIGNVKSVLELDKEILNINIIVNDEKALGVLQGNISELREFLDKYNFKKYTINFNFDRHDKARSKIIIDGDLRTIDLRV